MLKKISISILLLVFITIFNVNGKIQDSISLKGLWGFQKDPADEGIEKKWYLFNFKDSILLPGSMIEQNKGDKLTLQTKWTGSIYDSSWFYNPRMEKYRQSGNLKFPFWLTPKCHYLGSAWYQKKIIIPPEWESQRIILFMERPHWETRVWIDSTETGIQNSLSTPHVYDITSLIDTGTYTITVRVDNRIKEINVGPDSHSLTDHTQGNWNGIAGKIEIRTEPLVYIDEAKLFPDIQNKSVKAVINIINTLNESLAGNINMDAESLNSFKKIQFPLKLTQIEIKTDTTKIELYYFMGDNAQLWDEFNPVLYTLKLSLESKAGKSEKEIIFGIREFKTNGTLFEINGRPVFLRGNVDCAAFPLTGYPATDIASWERIFKICKSYGLNHVRFHSWCPPEAAFIAADMIGIYLQVEAASWANHGTTIGDGDPIDKYIYDETERIINAYGNHPSFCMMAYGNEPAGKNQVEFLGKYVEYW
ncbi:MAG: beta-glucuronidase, partial [Bacteroidales bacterium]|nr:beta-glucuronidase [Bacteroidales bacterium]